MFKTNASILKSHVWSQKTSIKNQLNFFLTEFIEQLLQGFSDSTQRAGSDGIKKSAQSLTINI